VLALSAQVGGGLLIAIALPRMAAVTTSVLLLSQPVMSVVMAMILVAETPSAFQLVGVLLVVLGVAVSTIRRDLLATGARRVMVAARRGP
jgi:drug/metabolite transporter (DMT)-like permease